MQAENSWTRTDHSNDFLYNDGSELNGNTGWYETFFRGYDPALGRFHQVDPLAGALTSHSPYNFGLNNPVFYNDPMGDYVEPVLRPEFTNRTQAELFAGTPGFGGGGGGSMVGVSTGSVSAGEFIGNALYGGYSGGTWNNGNATYFENDSEAAAWAIDNFQSFFGTEDNALASLHSIVSGGSSVHYKTNIRWTKRAGNNVSFVVRGGAQQGGPGDPVQNANVVAPIGFALEQLLMAVGLAGMTSTQDYIHANDKRSMKKNYVYEIFATGPNGMQVIKYGISSDKGYRVESQVRMYNSRNDGLFYDFYVKNHVMGRAQALIVEQFYVTMYAIQHNGNVPRDQYRPISWDLNGY